MQVLLNSVCCLWPIQWMAIWKTRYMALAKWGSPIPQHLVRLFFLGLMDEFRHSVTDLRGLLVTPLGSFFHRFCEGRCEVAVRIWPPYLSPLSWVWSSYTERLLFTVFEQMDNIALTATVPPTLDPECHWLLQPQHYQCYGWGSYWGFLLEEKQEKQKIENKKVDKELHSRSRMMST